MNRRIAVHQPCSMDWDSLIGSGRVRGCQHCDRQVQDMTQSSQESIDRTFRRLNGVLCMRYLTRRPQLRMRRCRTRRMKPAGALKTIVLRAAALAALAVPASAQSDAPVTSTSTAASEAGRAYNVHLNVVGPLGDAMPGSTLTIESDSQVAASLITTRADGTATVALAAGQYVVTATMPGMITSKLTLTVRKALGVKITLHPADEHETLFVGGAGVSDGAYELLFGFLYEADNMLPYSDDANAQALMEAAEDGYSDEIIDLVREGVDVNAVGTGGLTALMVNMASFDGPVQDDFEDLESTFRALLANSADVNGTTDQGIGVLTYAAALAPRSVLEELVELGALVNSTDHQGRTALMMAARTGRVEVMHFLLNHGARINHRDRDGWSALTYALHFDRQEVATALLDSGSDWRKPDVNGRTALHHAALAGMTDVLTRLINAGSFVNVRDAHGRTPFHLAAQYHNLDALNLLRDSGANLFARDDSGQDALDLASEGWQFGEPSKAMNWLMAVLR